MRDAIAFVVALFLLLVALSLIAALQTYQRRRQTARAQAAREGQRIVAELPHGSDLTLFTEHASGFSYGERRIDKHSVRAVRVLINGSPIAERVSRWATAASRRPAPSFEDQPEGIARDRWDVAIETDQDTVMVECGAIRERVSQELARSIFDAVSADISRRDKA